MLVSIFPDADADKGLDSSGKTVTIVAKAVPFIDISEFKAPEEPELPAQAMGDPRASSASSVVVSLISSVALISTLF